jgi:dTDP-D-glucose 4,6-dehydratase
VNLDKLTYAGNLHNLAPVGRWPAPYLRPCYGGMRRGLAITVDWYLGNMSRVDAVTSGDYREWIDLNFAGRNSA